ncbi:MAG: bifunctional riboflavin kinase/FAD synthetase [Prevotella sp.]|nr:bifunctional riboflavin kinase/FAD synthetase [Prevotella sp.]MDY6229793.1 bifunctional riboflavin kinase/FAD synthetase [Prevotella sp.]
MRTIFLDEATKLSGRAVATVGFFDGVHSGHRYLIDRLKAVARENNCMSMIITFDKHPRQVLNSDYKPMLLSTLDEKLNLLSQTGIDCCVVLPFTADMADLSAHDFMKTILSERLSVATLMIGYDNRFGHRREDGYEQYVAYGKELGISVIDSDSFSYGNGSVSSSMVRRFISAGDVERAAECLGRPYSLSGMVVHGEAKGRTIGFPTANIVPADADKLIPDGGVYAVLVSLDDSSTMLNGMMNIGSRPTFDGKMQTLEVHIFDFDGDIYKHSLRVFFIKKIRNERCFSSPDELAKQLETDEKVCRLQLLSRS